MGSLFGVLYCILYNIYIYIYNIQYKNVFYYHETAIKIRVGGREEV